VYSGVHFRKADVDGARIGEQVAAYRAQHYFRPLDDQRHGKDRRAARG
jgi:hypothetical protein